VIRFIYDGGDPVPLDNTKLMFRDALHLEKVTGRKHQEFMKAFWELDTEAQGVLYWFALYLADRENAPRLSTFDFDIPKLMIEIDVPDRLEPATEDGGEDGAAADPTPAAGSDPSAAEPTADPT
jgi:hypothetical protein